MKTEKKDPVPSSGEETGGAALSITMDTGKILTCRPGTRVKDLLVNQVQEGPLHVLGALVNNDVVSLSYPLEVDSDIKLLTMAHHDGWRVYRRSVSFLLAKSVMELFPEARFAVQHSLGTGFYCDFEQNGNKGITEEQLSLLDAHMRKQVDQGLAIKRRKIAFASAVNQFKEQQQWDKYNLLRFRNPPKVTIYWCDGFSVMAHGPLADNTAALDRYKLIPYPPGFVIQFPDRDNPPALPPFEPQPHLFQIFREHKDWGNIIGVNTVGQLNEAIASRQIEEVIKICEAFHEKKVAHIADEIFEKRASAQWILIAGPSSAGKTTLSKRLMVQLKVNGLRPVSISVDDYFRNRDDTPRDGDGNYDFEHVDALDLELLNEHLQRLDRGEEVSLPTFDFGEGKREYKGKSLKIAEDNIVILEGIHCLNPRLTHELGDERKYRIYISALTQLNLDQQNRISTTDNRLLRRMVRDNTFRGNSALDTLERWPSVRRGEKQWIFPYQQEADITFNSALDYELSVLRPLAEPLLTQVKPYHTQYAKARGLLEFLSCFLDIPATQVPPTSILREYIGGSSFTY